MPVIVGHTEDVIHLTTYSNVPDIFDKCLNKSENNEKSNITDFFNSEERGGKENNYVFNNFSENGCSFEVNLSQNNVKDLDNMQVYSSKVKFKAELFKSPLIKENFQYLPLPVT